MARNLAAWLTLTRLAVVPYRTRHLPLAVRLTLLGGGRLKLTRTMRLNLTRWLSLARWLHLARKPGRAGLLGRAMRPCLAVRQGRAVLLGGTI